MLEKEKGNFAGVRTLNRSVFARGIKTEGVLTEIGGIHLSLDVFAFVSFPLNFIVIENSSAKKSFLD